MSKKLHVSFILDETGSMGVVKEQTVSGFNEYIRSLKDGESAKDVRFTLTRFNTDKMQVQYEAVKLKEVQELDDYKPFALTPLYDAIGITIRSLEKNLGDNNALVVIQTDGAENSSREYDRAGIFKLIKEKTENDGWTFVFLGADQDAWAASAKIGVLTSNTLAYSSAETHATFTKAAGATNTYVSNRGVQTSSFWEDAEKRTDAETEKESS